MEARKETLYLILAPKVLRSVRGGPESHCGGPSFGLQ